MEKNNLENRKLGFTVIVMVLVLILGMIFVYFMIESTRNPNKRYYKSKAENYKGIIIWKEEDYNKRSWMKILKDDGTISTQLAGAKIVLFKVGDSIIKNRGEISYIVKRKDTTFRHYFFDTLINGEQYPVKKKMSKKIIHIKTSPKEE